MVGEVMTGLWLKYVGVKMFGVSAFQLITPKLDAILGLKCKSVTTDKPINH